MDENRTQRSLYLKTNSKQESMTIGNPEVNKYVQRMSMRENPPDLVTSRLTRKNQKRNVYSGEFHDRDRVHDDAGDD